MSTKTVKCQLRMYRGWHIERDDSSYFLVRINSIGNSTITRRAKTITEAKEIIDHEEGRIRKKQYHTGKNYIKRGKHES